ncbi:hypothetical protein [Methylobacterium dankookense]|uniref:Uncharacterized protein n=1 Tax=Methylobacterium dankookense TaxID=560405 RepID=A0A564FZC7_9HYPH|nr:hypothetical protein [Methylobacterium dankookense]GJD57306.1 hypothetical protein IFDJLNFL_3207 [Methylobacterium dankookense]VUF13214.1 hypothetical protein MTDSW087_02913 [Methylobacterium dankookense]
MSTVVPFLRPAAARPGSWSQQELAEFYRVEAALIRAGIGIASEHGLSDEGEPWFVFCRPDGDAIIHFARIDGSYLIASEVLDRPVRGADFRALIDQIARLHPDLLPIPAAAAGTKLVVHPAALLAALVAAAALSLSAEDAHAGEIGAGPEGAFPLPASGAAGAAQGQPQPAKAKGAGGPSDQESSRKQIEAIILSAMIFAAEALAADHRDASAELGLALADPAGGAPSQIAQGDAVSGSSGAHGSGLGAVSATQSAGLTAQGSGASQAAASAGSRIDAAPAVRTDLPGDRAGPPGSEAGHPSPSFGIDVALIGAPAEAGAVRTGSQQTSTAGRTESAAATLDGSGAAGGDQRGSSAPAPTADPGGQSRSADAGQSDAGSGTAQPAWANAGVQTVVNRTPATVSRDADGQGNGQGNDNGQGNNSQGNGKGHGSLAETAAGDSAQVEQANRGNGQGNGNGQGSQSEAAAGDNTQVEQTGRSNGQGNNGQGNGNGHGSQDEAAAGNNLQVEQTSGGNGQGNNGQGNGNGHGSQAETVAGDNAQVEQTGRSNGQGNNGQGNGNGSQAEAAAGDSAKVEQTGHGNGQGNNGQSNGSQAQSDAHGAIESGTHGNGNGRMPDNGGDQGSVTQSKAVPAAGVDPQAGRPDSHGHGTDAAEQGDHRGPGAHGAHGIEPASVQGTPKGTVEARSDAAPGAPAHASANPAASGHGADKATDAQLPNDGHGATGSEASGRGAAADHASAQPNGHSQDAGSPSAEHARGGPSDHGPAHAADSTTSSDPPNGGLSGAKEHGAAAAHGQSPDAADHGPPMQTGSGPATAEDHPGTPPASAAQTASSGNGHAQAGQAPADHGAASAVTAATPAAGQEATAHGADNGLAAPSRGPSPTAASQAETTSQSETSPAHHVQGQVAAGGPAGDRVDHGSAESPASQTPDAQPQHPSGEDAAKAVALPPPGQTGSTGTANALSGHAGPDQPPPRAAIDASGNLVFHADNHRDPAPPAASHGPDDPAAHPTVGLVGISDQAHPVHDLYHHT